MKNSVIFIIFIICLFSSEKTFATSSPIKEILSNTDKFETFIYKNINYLSIRDKNDIQKMVEASTKGLFIHSYIKDSLFFKEFLFNALKSKTAFPKLLSLFLHIKKFIYFSLIFILTMIASALIGEFQYSLKLVSIKRITFNFFRFLIINSARVWAFFYIFNAHVEPIFNIYLSSISTLKDHYPIIYKANFLITMFI